MDLSYARMKAQYRDAIKTPQEFLKFHMCEHNVRIWYVLLSNITGDENEYIGGEYIVRIELPGDFPENPPHFYFLTPQGLYGLDKEVCISIGRFHPDNYRAVLGVKGFCNNLVSGLIGWRDINDGIRILNTSVEEKKALAAASREYNRTHYSNILALIESSYAAYSTRWTTSRPSE